MKYQIRDFDFLFQRMVCSIVQALSLLIRTSKEVSLRLVSCIYADFYALNKIVKNTTLNTALLSFKYFILLFNLSHIRFLKQRLFKLSLLNNYNIFSAKNNTHSCLGLFLNSITQDIFMHKYSEDLR